MAGHTIRGLEIPGPGPAVVLLHGFPDNTHLYDRLYPLLAGERRVIAFDFIGWGRSDKPTPGTYRYSTSSMQAELAAVVAHLRLTDITLVVHDASGPPGIDYTLANPTTVANLVILNTYYWLSPTLRPPEAITVFADPGLRAVEKAIQADPAATEAIYRWQLGRFLVAAEDPDGFIDGLWAQFPDARPAFLALNNVLFEEVGRRSPSRLSELKMPVTILFGASDPYLNPGVASAFAEHIPGSKLQLVDRASHFVQVDAPQAVAAALGVS